MLALSLSCTNALQSPEATFGSPAKADLVFAAYLKAPVPQVDARFGAPVKVHPTGIATAASFEDVQLPSGEWVENGGAVYLFDPEDLSAPPLRFVAPNVDPGDGNIPLPARPKPLPQFMDWPSIYMDLDAERIVIGVPGEDAAAPADSENVAEAWLDNSAPEAGAVYVYDRSEPNVVLQYLKAPNADAGDLFGAVVALSDSWLAIGASTEDSAESEDPSDNSAPESGAVYIYERQNGVFVFRQYLKAPKIHKSGLFGANVAFDGDFMAVGAPGEAGQSKGESSADYPANGAIYVYHLQGDTWQFTTRVAGPLSRYPSLFGAVLSFDDGRVAVASAGLSCQEAASPMTGAAYVVGEHKTDDWSSDACIAGRPDTFYGFSIVVLGPHLLLGAPWDNSGRPDDPTDASLAQTGVAYLYNRDASGAWREQAYIKAPNMDGADVFGVSVGMAPGLLAVGAPQESGGESGPDANLDDNSALYAGALYVFRSDDLTE